MNSEYVVELLSFRIVDLHISADIDTDQETLCESEFKGYMRAPSDPADPTVLIGMQAIFKGAGDSVQVFCEAESIFKFSPIPTDWKEAVSQYCMPAVRDKIIERLQSIFQSIGQPISLIPKK